MTGYRNRRKFILYLFVCLVMTAFFLLPGNMRFEAMADTPPALSDQRFNKALVDMVEEYKDPDITEQAAGRNPYIAERLVLKSDDPFVDPEDYGAVDAIRDRNGFYILQFDSVRDTKRAEAKLEDENGTIYVEPDGFVCAQGSYTLYPVRDNALWSKSVLAIGADDLGQSLEHVSGSVTVAVLDTGISYTAAELAGRIDEQRATSSYWPYNADQNKEDAQKCSLDSGHGTHVAGIVAKCTRTIADKVKIMPVRVLDNNGRGYMSIVANGIRYAADHGAQVLNLSLGGPATSTKMIQEVVEYADSLGCTVVTAAGNREANDSSDSALKHTPSNIEECIVVGAAGISQTGDYYIPGFSLTGHTVDVVAPGVSVFSNYYLFNGSDYGTGYGTDWYTAINGTSMAAPHVAAAAAMVRLAYPDAKPLEVERMIQLSTVDKNNSGKNDTYGYGMIQLGILAQQGASLRSQAAEYMEAKIASEEEAARIAATQEAARKAAAAEAARKAAQAEAARKAAQAEAARKAAQAEAERKAAEQARAREAAMYADTNPRANVSYVVPLKQGQQSGALKVIGLGVNDSVIAWSSSDPSTISVSGNPDGTCSICAAGNSGQATICAVTASKRTVSFQVRAQKKKIKLKSVKVASKRVTLRCGETYDLQALPYPATAKGSVKCSSSRKSVVSVTSNGVLTARKSGTAVITVKCGKKKTKVKVRVLPS